MNSENLQEIEATPASPLSVMEIEEKDHFIKLAQPDEDEVDADDDDFEEEEEDDDEDDDGDNDEE